MLKNTSWIRVLVLEVFVMIVTKGRRSHWHPVSKGRDAAEHPTARRAAPHQERWPTVSAEWMWRSGPGKLLHKNITVAFSVIKLEPSRMAVSSGRLPGGRLVQWTSTRQ